MDLNELKAWTEEALSLIDHRIFRISDEGPLHAPVSRFTIRRNEDLTLILETEAPGNATSRAQERPSGAVWISTDEVKLTSLAGPSATLTGVERRSLSDTTDHTGKRTIHEICSIHTLQVDLADASAGVYTVEWLQNLPSYPFIWPDSISTVVEASVKRVIANDDDGITVHHSDSREGFSRSAARLTVQGQVLYVLGTARNASHGSTDPGCILYRGTPDAQMRQKIRVALSFALGTYLVELGCTTYTQDWQIVRAQARTGYSLRGMAFELGNRPPAPLSAQPIQFHIERAPLNRMVSALVAVYDSFGLGNLSWAYWHACAATVHTAPAQFGAAIEALGRAYLGEHPTIAHSILAAEEWKHFKDTFEELLDKSGLEKTRQEGLMKNFGRLNQIPQRDVLKAILKEVGIELGKEEAAAWGRRNQSAHGMPIPEGHELSAIRDMTLLKTLFHRMLLRMTNATDHYIDYASLGIPHRRLEVPAA